MPCTPMCTMSHASHASHAPHAVLTWSLMPIQEQFSPHAHIPPTPYPRSPPPPPLPLPLPPSLSPPPLPFPGPEPRRQGSVEVRLSAELRSFSQPRWDLCGSIRGGSGGLGQGGRRGQTGACLVASGKGPLIYRLLSCRLWGGRKKHHFWTFLEHALSNWCLGGRGLRRMSASLQITK